MWIQIIENIFLGFAISAAPGAIFFETIRRILSKKYLVIPFQVGNFCGMLTVIIVVLLGVSAILSNSTSINVFYGLSGVVLLYLGIQSMFYMSIHASSDKRVITIARSRYSSFMTGYILAIANPLSIVFWISIVGTFYQQSDTSIPILINILSVLLGALLLFILLIVLVSYLRSNIKELYLIWLARIFGAILIAYGIFSLSKLLVY